LGLKPMSETLTQPRFSYLDLKKRVLSTKPSRETTSVIKIIKAFKEDTILRALLPEIEVIRTEKGLIVRKSGNFTAEKIAKVVGISRKQLFETLKKQFGISIKELLDSIIEYKKDQYRIRVVKRKEWKTFEEFVELPIIKHVIENHKDGREIALRVYDLCMIFDIQPEILFKTEYNEELGREIYLGEEYVRKYIEYLRESGLKSTTINSYKSLLRLFFKVHNKPIPFILTTSRYHSKYGDIAWFDENDRLEILKALKELYEEGKIMRTDYERVVAGIIAQHELCCRHEGLETFRYTVRSFTYKLRDRSTTVNAIITMTQEKKRKGSEEKEVWRRPMKAIWFNLVKDYLPFPKGYKKYQLALKLAYLRIIKRKKLFTDERFYSMSEEEIIEYVKNMEIPNGTGRKPNYSMKWRIFAERYIKDPKWEYAIKNPTHIWRHTGIQAWAREVGRDLGFINSMTHSDPGIYINIYGTMPIDQLVAMVYGIPIERGKHDFLYGRYLIYALEHDLLPIVKNKHEFLEKAREAGLV